MCTCVYLCVPVCGMVYTDCTLYTQVHYTYTVCVWSLCHYVGVGLHPDQATDAAVDFALTAGRANGAELRHPRRVARVDSRDEGFTLYVSNSVMGKK